MSLGPRRCTVGMPLAAQSRRSSTTAASAVATTQPDAVCVVCGNREITELVELRRVPVLCNAPHRTQHSARRAPLGDIRLAQCGRCGHIFNTLFDPTRIAYTSDYQNTLHGSPRFDFYAEAQARRLVNTYDIRHTNVIEIGCGNGEFLEILCDMGSNIGRGYDPRGTSQPRPPTATVQISTHPYTPTPGRTDVDLVCCRHVLEHVPDPAALLGSIRSALDDRCSAIAFLEVPAAEHMLASGTCWDVIYEHVSYFTKRSLSWLLRQCGLRTLRLATEFGGQYIAVDAALARAGAEPISAFAVDVGETLSATTGFAGACSARLRTKSAEVHSLRQQGKRVVCWGAGSKGVTFCNAMGEDSPIEYVVDVNAAKHGLFIAGTGQRIVAPEFLREYRPDAIVVMNAIYEEEISLCVRQMGLGAVLIVA